MHGSRNWDGARAGLFLKDEGFDALVGEATGNDASHRLVLARSDDDPLSRLWTQKSPKLPVVAGSAPQAHEAWALACAVAHVTTITPIVREMALLRVGRGRRWALIPSCRLCGPRL